MKKPADFLHELKCDCNEIIWDTASKVPSRAIPTLQTQFELGRRNAAQAILRRIELFEELSKK